MTPSKPRAILPSRLQGRGFSGLFQTTFAFATIVGVQQLIVLPFIASHSDSGAFSNVIVFLCIAAVVSNVTGGELANTGLVSGRRYDSGNVSWDFHLLLIPVFALFGALWLTIAIPLGFTLGQSVIYGGITLLTALRLFLAFPFRYRQQFGVVTLAHGAYAISSSFGLILVWQYGWLLAPFLLGEIVSATVLLVIHAHRGHRLIFAVRNPAFFIRTAQTYMSLAGAGLMANLVAYLDRLMIYPLLGATALAVFYAASVLPRSISALINPLAGWLLAKFGSMDESQGNAIFEKIYPLLFPVAIAAGGGSFIIGTLGLRILYPQYFIDGRAVVPAVSIAVGISSSAYLLHAYSVRFLPAASVLGANALFASAFVGTAIWFSHFFGIVGFAWASAVAQLVLFLTYLTLAKRQTMKRDTRT